MGKLVDKGVNILVFPEGTRTGNGSIGRMKPGIGVLAERAAVPIVPVLIQGAYRVWPKGALLPRLGRVSVVFGEQMRAEKGAGDGILNAVVGLKGELSGCRIGNS